MPEYTSNLGLYKPSRNDAIEIDTSLSENFVAIDNKLGDSMVGADGTAHKTLKVRLDKEHNQQNKQIEGNSYYHNVTVEYKRDEVSGTDYTLVRVPYLDEKGNINKLQRGFPNNDPYTVGATTARKFAKGVNATVATNASTYNVESKTRRGTDIFEGKVITENPPYFRWELGVLADGTLKAYPPESDAQTLLDDGVVYSFAGFCPFIIDGVPTLDDYHINVSSVVYEPHPRNAIAQYENKDILFLACDGRKEGQTGMTVEDMARVLEAEGVKFAYNLDGGGSTQVTVRNQLVHRNVNDDGFLERPVPDFIYFRKEIVTDRDKDFSNVHWDMGELGHKLQMTDRRIDQLGHIPQQTNVNTTPVDDLNDITVSGMYWAYSGIGNKPTDSGVSTWAILHYQYDSSNAMQIAFPFNGSLGSVNTRRTYGGGWTDWRAM